MMNSESSVTLTVYFDGQYWVGVFERECGGRYAMSKILFGPEPKNHEIAALIADYHRLRFTEPIPVRQVKKPKTVSPKRLQRQISLDLAKTGVSTKAQEALSRQRELDGLERRQAKRVRSEEAERKKFALKQTKKKEKHRGR